MRKRRPEDYRPDKRLDTTDVAKNQLFASLYGDLRRLADSNSAAETGLVSSTTLLHEAYIGMANREAYFCWINLDIAAQQGNSLRTDQQQRGQSRVQARVRAARPIEELHPLLRRKRNGLMVRQIFSFHGAAISARSPTYAQPLPRKC